jgi:ribosomal protein S18 acetylase RimI-like enzyme
MIEVIRIQQHNRERIAALIPLLDQNEHPNAQHIAHMTGDDRTYLFLALENGTPAGYALAYCFPYFYSVQTHAYLYDIEVLETHRRKGIGRRLIDATLAALKADGCGEMWLGTATDNSEAQALFGRTGAIKTEETFFDYTYTV